ncbi:MAG: S-layer homology domain-containing protein [Candidatus Wallbacteria bacterium]|nr:S-layer homology domain-containing protein [Candidatus Wallbacteria bacterium]
MKRIALFVLAIFAVTAFANPFSDVKFNHWAYDAVSKLSAKGIVTGYPDGTFKGDKAVTRYDMAVIIARLLEKMNTTPSVKGKMAKGDLDSVQKLVVEFADELSLLGVKVTALEDEMSAVKDDLAVLKEDVKTIKATGGQGGKIRITGDIRSRFEDYGYDEAAVEAAANENIFEQKLGLNLDMMIDPDVTACLRLEKFGYWNTQMGDWSGQQAAGTGALALQRDTDLRAYLAYIQVKDFFGWADQVRFGRQRIALGHNLTIKGVADGITFLKTVDNKRDIVCRIGGLKFDDSFTIVNDVNNDNDGLDLAYMDWTFDLHDVMAELYIINARDAFSADGVGLCDATTTWKHVKRHTWYGLAVSGNPVPELTLWGEYSWLKWDESVDVDGNLGTEDGDAGFLFGLNWDANKKTVVKLQYTKFDQWFFRPQNGAMRTLWDYDTYLDGSDYLYDVAGYRADFDDIMAEVGYQMTDKSLMTVRYEAINDNTNLVANQISDDRNIFTGIFKYQYKPNTAISFLYRQINCEDASTTNNVDSYVNPATNTVAIPTIHVVGGAANGGREVRYGDVTNQNILNPDTTALQGAGVGDVYNVSDVTLFRMQLDVNF